MYKKDRSKLKTNGPKKAPAKVNNYDTCKTTVARSLNIQPVSIVQKRDAEEVIQVANGKLAKDLVHKPKMTDIQKEFPIIGDTKAKKKPITRPKKID
jgi:hypothetical protein